jgi:hypothetical protein
VGQRLALIGLIGVLVAACGSAAVSAPSAVPLAPTATAQPTPRPTASRTARPSPSPTPTATPSATPTESADPLADQPYTIHFPSGWTALDLNTPGWETYMTAYAEANPETAVGFESLKRLPNVRLVLNSLLGDAVVLLAIPSQGYPLRVIGKAAAAQFAALPGSNKLAAAKTVTLPAGQALHWVVNLTSNKVGGGKQTVTESIYLVVDDTTAVVVEFVSPKGGVVPGEKRIVRSLHFRT